MFYLFYLYDLKSFKEELNETFWCVRVHTLPVVFFNSLVYLALAFEDIKYDGRDLTVDLARVGVAESDKPIVQKVLSDSKFS